MQSARWQTPEQKAVREAELRAEYGLPPIDSGTPRSPDQPTQPLRGAVANDVGPEQHTRVTTMSLTLSDTITGANSHGAQLGHLLLTGRNGPANANIAQIIAAQLGTTLLTASRPEASRGPEHATPSRRQCVGRPSRVSDSAGVRSDRLEPGEKRECGWLEPPSPLAARRCRSIPGNHELTRIERLLPRSCPIQEQRAGARCISDRAGWGLPGSTRSCLWLVEQWAVKGRTRRVGRFWRARSGMGTSCP